MSQDQDTKRARLDAHRKMAHRQLAAMIEKAEQLAHREGLHVTAHALNNAKNASGWEMAGDIEQAGKAARRHG